ncbi:TPA: HNH endonuclease, partial [Vibrio cholerae]
AEIKKEYSVDPIKDLKPLCPNCHGIIHRTHPPISVDSLINLLRSRN